MTAKDETCNPEAIDPSAQSIAWALGIATALAAVTRLPFARTSAFDFDEVGYLDAVRLFQFPMHHTLFLAAARLLGQVADDAYRGFVWLDILTSSGALVAVWRWLRSLAGPRTAAAGALALGFGPTFWSYGAMAGNYTAIPLVGSVLLGVAFRGRNQPRPWHPYAAAVILALGAGYRLDIGAFWLPIFLVILRQHRWLRALQAALVLLAVSLAWLIPMFRDAGGLALYHQETAVFAYKAGYLNSVWHLGVIDAPVRYALKIAMALVWTLGPGLLLVPRGLVQVRGLPQGRFLFWLLILSVTPALLFHLLLHFGVAGYAFHYIPALVGLMALGLARASSVCESRDIRGARSGLIVAAVLAAIFLFYPTNYDRSGFRGSFDLAFARHTRIGLRTETPLRDPALWRTANSQVLPGGSRPGSTRKSLSEIWTK